MWLKTWTDLAETEAGLKPSAHPHHDLDKYIKINHAINSWKCICNFFSCQYRHPGEYQAWRGYARSLVRSTRDVKEMYIEKRKIHCLVCKLSKENENLPNYTNILLKNWKTTSHQSKKSYPLWFGTLFIKWSMKRLVTCQKVKTTPMGAYFLLRMRYYASYWGVGGLRDLCQKPLMTQCEKVMFNRKSSISSSFQQTYIKFAEILRLTFPFNFQPDISPSFTAG